MPRSTARGQHVGPATPATSPSPKRYTPGVSAEHDSAASPAGEPKPKRRKRRRAAKGKQLSLRDLVGPRLDFDALSRRLGTEIASDHRGHVASVVDRVLLEDVQRANRSEHVRALVLKALLGSLGVYGILIGSLLVVLHRAPALAARMAPLYDAAGKLEAAGAIITFGAVVSLITWLRAAYANTEIFALAQPHMSVSEVTWGFFVPILNLVRPYQALSRLHACSDPDQLPDAPEVVTEQRAASYRTQAQTRRHVAVSRADVRFPIGAFWAAYVVAQLGGRLARPDPSAVTLAAVSGYAFGIAGVLGLWVVHAIVTRRLELTRRMRRILEEQQQLVEDR
jgi:Domain of unknown function (DUF4328)